MAALDLLDDFQAQGRYSFPAALARALLGGTSDDAWRHQAQRLVRKGKLVRPRHGFHVIVPPEYRATGAPPASWFIDDLMGFMGRPYYVGLLSAAAIFGAAHQAPQEFQVMCDLPQKPIQVGRVRIRFFMKRHLARSPTQRVNTHTGTMAVSRPETTALDLIDWPHAAAGWGNVVTVLDELAPRIAPRALEAAFEAEALGLPTVQRLGFLWDRLGHRSLARVAEVWLQSRRVIPVLFDPAGEAPEGAVQDARWKLVVNVDEDDLLSEGFGAAPEAPVAKATPSWARAG